MTNYIGLSVTYHDPALAIVDESGEVVFAEATERYLQYKRALNCEPDSIDRMAELIETYCDVTDDWVVAFNWSRKRPFYETFCALADYFTPAGLMRPRFDKRSTFLHKYQIFHMLACQTNAMAKGGINLVRKLRERRPDCTVRFVDFNHHLTHAAAACYTSPFEEAACLIVDSFGDGGSLAYYRYKDGRIHLLEEMKGIESLGFYYMKLTELCGFDWLRGEEWKVMGLAPYGRLDEAVYALLQETLAVEGCSLRQRLDRICACMEQLEARTPLQSMQQKADLAYTGQYFFSELMVQLVNQCGRLCPSDHLVLGGGCALNSSFNGQVLQQTSFEELYVPSAPADDGTALGAALLAYDRDHPERQPPAEILSPYLGSRLSSHRLHDMVRFGGLPCVKHSPDRLCEETAQLLVQGKLVGWLQGKAEFGPRALGNRSILADPRDASTKDRINERVKFREPFRPFAPAILHECGTDYFEQYQLSPYMERTLRFRREVRDKVPAVVHVDGTGRLQSVKREWNPRFYDLLQAFYRLTGIPLLLNTSFNVMGKPMAHSVEDAVSVYLTTGLDALVIEDYLFVKSDVGNH